MPTAHRAPHPSRRRRRDAPRAPPRRTQRRVGAYLRGAGVAVALCCGISALAMLLLPMLLVLLMVLFDTVTHGTFVLIGAWFDWLRGTAPGSADGLPAFQTIAFHPGRVALDSLARSLPCLAGLMLVSLRRGTGGHWWWIVLLWAIAAYLGGATVAVILLPGCVAATLLALSRPATARR